MSTTPKRQNQRGTRLDPWLDHYADRANGMRASEVRSLFAVASRPEVVSLAGGMPNIDSLPLDFLADLSARIMRDNGPKALQYGSGQGEIFMREQIVEVMRYDGIRAHPDDVVITTGSQQALDLVTEIFINPGDIIVAEAPSYVGALGVFRAYEAEVVHVPLDDDGLIPEELDRTLTELRAQNRPVKFLYTVPNYHNPAGVTLSEERRPQIVEICQRHSVLILEDNPYGLLGFDQDPLPALKSYDPDQTIYLGSFSKMFGPGYRIGWAAAPHAVREKLTLAQESAVLCPSMWGQMVMTEYLTTFDWYTQVKAFRGEYRARGEAMLEALAEYLPECQWTTPNGGFYTWVTLPPGVDAKAMLPRAVTNLVAYVSGTAFYYDGRGGDHMRLSFCYPPPERIKEGVRRLARTVHAEMELVEMLGTNRTDRPLGTVQAPAPDQV